MSLVDFPSYPPAVQQEILNGPAMIPPNGTIPNLINPPNHNGEAIAIAVICLSIGVSFGIIRLYSRLIVSRKVHIEDYLGLLAFGPYSGVAWAYFRCLAIGGFSVHQWDIRLKDMFDIAYVCGLEISLFPPTRNFVVADDPRLGAHSVTQQALVILPISYSILMLFAKTAILLESNRLFVPRGKRNAFFWASGAMGLLNVAIYIAAITATTFSCVPLEKLWRTWVDGKCINRKITDTFAAAFNLAIDLFILLLPQNVIWKLHMSKSRKIGVSLVFSVGILACVCAAGRLYATATLDYLGDTTYGVSKTSIWALAENTCVLVVFCMPAIPQAFSGLDMKWATDIFKPLLPVWACLRTFRSRTPTNYKVDDSNWPTRNAGRMDLRELNAFPVGRADHYAVEALSLEEINLVREYRAKLGKATGPISIERSGALRTTEIGQEETYSPNDEYDPYLIITHEHHHP